MVNFQEKLHKKQKLHKHSDLAGERRVVVLLAGGELDLGDGGDAPRVLHLPRRLLDALAQHGPLAVQPRDLKEGSM